MSAYNKIGRISRTWKMDLGEITTLLIFKWSSIRLLRETLFNKGIIILDAKQGILYIESSQAKIVVKESETLFIYTKAFLSKTLMVTSWSWWPNTIQAPMKFVFIPHMTSGIHIKNNIKWDEFLQSINWGKPILKEQTKFHKCLSTLKTGM